MPGLSFSNQSQNGRPSFWWIPIVLIVVSVMLITLCVRFEGGGPFAVARGVVHTVTKPIESVCSAISSPFRSVGRPSNSEEMAKLEQENRQLRTLVAELEEYRQQDQRLTTMSQFSDIYGLESISGEVLSTTSGWDRTATVNRGSADGVQVGMGVMSSCGLYGMVESVTSNTCVVRLINDANASVSAMVQNSRAHGIMHGAYDGTLTLEYVPIEKAVGEGDVVITSGSGGAYPRGILIGTVRTIETDSSKLYHRITVDPIYSIDSCEEVLILTGSQSETSTVLNESLLQTVVDSANTVRPGTVGVIANALLNGTTSRSRQAAEAERARQEAEKKAAEEAEAKARSNQSSNASSGNSGGSQSSSESQTNDGGNSNSNGGRANNE